MRHIGVLVTRSIHADNLWQEPAIQMIRNLAVFRERICTNRNAVWTEIVFDHARHSLRFARASTRPKISAHTVCRVAIFTATVSIALSSMKPVVNSHRNFL